jgi:hypothetical protein
MVLFHVRDAFRSGDFWLENSHRHGDLKHALLPAPAAMERVRLAVPKDPEAWLADRRDRLSARLRELGTPAPEPFRAEQSKMAGFTLRNWKRPCLMASSNSFSIFMAGFPAHVSLICCSKLRVSRRHSSICAPARYAPIGSGC